MHDVIDLVVQVNARFRDQITDATSASREEVEYIASAAEKVQSWLEGKTVRKVIPVRLVNIAFS